MKDFYGIRVEVFLFVKIDIDIVSITVYLPEKVIKIFEVNVNDQDANFLYSILIYFFIKNSLNWKIIFSTLRKII